MLHLPGAQNSCGHVLPAFHALILHGEHRRFKQKSREQTIPKKRKLFLEKILTNRGKQI